jgi:hypothetical protein
VFPGWPAKRQSGGYLLLIQPFEPLFKPCCTNTTPSPICSNKIAEIDSRAGLNSGKCLHFQNFWVQGIQNVAFLLKNTAVANTQQALNFATKGALRSCFIYFFC